MAAPMRKEAMDELEKIAAQNRKAGTWVDQGMLSDRIFVPKEFAEAAARGGEDPEDE